MVSNAFKTALCIPFLCVISAAFATGRSGFAAQVPDGWVAVARNGDEAFYLHQRSIKKNYPFISVWMLQDIDFKTGLNESKLILKKTGVKSQKILWELDCQRRLYRMKALVQFSEPLGAGEVVVSNNNFLGPWGNTPPDSVGGLVIDMVCGSA